MPQRFAIVFGFVLFATTVAFAQAPSAAAGGALGIESNPSTNLPGQPIGPEDLVSLSVYDSPEFSRTVRVAPDGTIRLPMLKSTIAIAGLVPSEAEKVVAAALKNENLLVDPFVILTVAEYKSRPINVMGAVRSPIIFQAVGNVTLLDALARAGGIGTDAGPAIIVTKPTSQGGEPAAQKVLIKPLLQGTDASLNLTLRGGENIRVPQAEQIIVQGNVNHPGVFPVLDPQTANTVTSAIAQAGGLAQFWEHTAYIYRTDDKGVKQTITVPLSEILRRKKPDIALQARDTLYVPDSPKRRVTQETVQAVTGVAAGVTTGMAIYAHP